MEVIVIDRVETQPENAVGFPQYLLCRLLEQGPALLEAEGTTSDAERIEWQLTPRRKSDSRLSVLQNKTMFRSTLARFGFLCGVSPYGGHTLFQLRFTDVEEARPERFAIYLCNEPTMGFWIRVYLYGIDGMYPNCGGMYDKTPNLTTSDL